MATTAPQNPPQASQQNLDWLLSEPLLNAALSEIKTMTGLDALQENFQVAEEAGKQIPESFRAKLDAKRKAIWESMVEREMNDYLSKSGLGHLVYAKRKWDDVHFMAEAHGVGSSIPMVNYTGLSQEDMETYMRSFYAYLKDHKLEHLNAPSDQTLKQEALQRISQCYAELYETATGEFGGYNPFEDMLEHSPERVAVLLGAVVVQE